MKAVTWQGKRKLDVRDVEEPRIVEPTDAVVDITSTAICGSDLHLYEVMGPFIDEGFVMGHEGMGVVREVGSAVSDVAVGDRVVISCQIACGTCFMCTRNLQSQCETTQNRDTGFGGSLFGYTQLYGNVPGVQAQAARVPFADYTLIKVRSDLPDERYLFLSDILPTAWQGVQYADVPEGGTLGVLGLGPVGQLAARMGRHLGHRVLAADLVADRRAMAERHGVEAFDVTGDLVQRMRNETDGRGPDSVVDAVGTEAHGDRVAKIAQTAGNLLPKKVAQLMISKAGIDSTAAMHTAIDLVRRGGTISFTGAYTGAIDPFPMQKVWDKELTLRNGAVNVRRWLDDLLPLVEDPADPLGLDDLVTHHGSLDDAPRLYSDFQHKRNGCVKVVLHA
jgi:threonine dehydrogenase-like Zn-dependent dehydrogenase